MAPLDPTYSSQLADEFLHSLGLTPSSSKIIGGTQNHVISYHDLSLAVRVSPPDLTIPASRGYQVASHLGPDIAMVPRDSTIIQGHVLALFDLATPLPRTASTWTFAQILAAEVHRSARPDFHLPLHDSLILLTRRLPLLEDTSFAALISPMRSYIERHERRLRDRSREPRVLVHGDLAPSQIVMTNTPHLIDFDRAAYGEPEVDYGRLWAEFAAGLLPEDNSFLEVLDAVSLYEEPRIEVIKLYGLSYCLRNLLVLCTLPDPDPVRLVGFATPLGLSRAARSCL